MRQKLRGGGGGKEMREGKRRVGKADISDRNN